MASKATGNTKAVNNRSDASGGKGKIITFYSYKGGTGRSMMMANVAWVLACSGMKVLAIDWDLEAPGLHRYFQPFLLDKELTASDGLIDFVFNFALEAVTPDTEEKESDWYKQSANILRYALSINYEFPKGGRLDFVPAGRQGISYAARVNSFDWEKFYDRLGGGVFLEEVKKQMCGEYDYILIDSRTGVSDTSGICTIQMPDILVPCFTLNNQGIDGALRITKTVFEKRRESGIRVFPVPMRLDNAENEKLDRRRKEAKSKFAGFPNLLAEDDFQTYWNEIPVFYVPYYSYEEVLAVFAQERSTISILAAAERLTKYLTDKKIERVDKEALPTKEKREQVLALYAGESFENAPEVGINQIADEVIERLSSADRARARRVLMRLIRIAPDWEKDKYDRQQVALDKFSVTELSIIEQLINCRLLISAVDSATGKQTIQIIRKEFLTDWAQLQKWLKEDHEFLLWLTQLQGEMEKWQRNKSDGSLAISKSGDSTGSDAFLLDGDKLTEAEIRLKERYDDIYPAERSYIEESQKKQRNQIKGNQKLEKSENNPLSVEKSKKPYYIPQPHSTAVREAQDIVRGQQANLKEMQELANRLKTELQFDYARRILLRASRHENISEDKKVRLRIFQQLALCTYKDNDLPADQRLDQALGILNEVEDHETTTNQETLGLLGSIYKRKWEVDNLRQNLERSLYFYLRGYAQGPVNDQGYTGINAAFILDKLASLEGGEAEEANRKSPVAERRRHRAREIRQDIINQVGVLISDPEHQWVNNKFWYYATIAEAYFGLKRYDEAVQWLIEGQAAAGEIYEWELESCARQLAALARLQDEENLKTEEFANTPAWASLEKAFADDSVPRTAFLGKIGLALSGGGFRASLYHLGVLGRLAELDVLRYVEILSCVSGGSIVGAHYYLKVRHLLQTKTENEITREDYITIVREMIDEFVEGVQENVRMSIAINPLKIMQMFWKRGYSRTTRAGELYEKYLYSRVKDGEQDKERWLNELEISPLIKNENGEAVKCEGFSPKYQNWRRDAKVPILVLNAATLNTGHTWQFTVSWMGESPAGIDSEIDGNDRLRRMYYSDAPREHQKVRLGDAVGASAAVPGIFEPLTLDKLYPNHIVRLVDGGVCDNQGVASLLEQDCKVLLVSDASGQMESEPATSGNIFRVLLRSYNIFQARIRGAQYHDLKGRKRSGLLNGLMFVHLKEDLEVDPVDWVKCPDPYQASDDSRLPSRRGPLTRYGISKEIQELLSGIRTDLDSFSEAEAYALMVSGYRMTEYQFKHEKCVEGFSGSPTPEEWKFLPIESDMKTGGEGYEYLKTLLAAGGSIAFKVWQIDWRLKYLVRGVLFALIFLIAAVFYDRWEKTLPGAISDTGTNILSSFSVKLNNLAALLPTITFNQIAFAFLSLFGGFILLRILVSLVGDWLAQNIVRLVRWKDTLRRIAVTVFITTAGFIISLIHLYFFDKLFLRLGSMETLKRKSKEV